MESTVEETLAVMGDVMVEHVLERVEPSIKQVMESTVEYVGVGC